MGGFIAIFSIFIAGSIPLTAIITAHQRSKLKLKIKMAEKEIELEKIRLVGYQQETEKMKLELEHSKQLLLESKIT